jgi:glycosyltransferase involved in cell wall biosynthesis
MRRKDVELIVVDDGSNDKRTLKEMAALIAQGIHVVRHENRGLAAARNAGISVSQGEYILPLDADNRLCLGYIDHGIQILDANPHIGVVYADAEYIGMRTGRWHVGSFDRDRLLKWNYIDACAVYRRSIWEQNRGYDSTMPIQGLEDWDFWLSTFAHGWSFAYIPEVLFEYRVSENSMIARASGSEASIEEFIAMKHGLLYRRTWQKLAMESKSVKATVRNLCELLKFRVKLKIHKQ